MTKRNYTLSEMLAVLAIIAILAGLAVPTINIARGKAHETSAMASCNEIANALKMYENTYSRFPTIEFDKDASDRLTPVGGGSDAANLYSQTNDTEKYDVLIFALSGVNRLAEDQDAAKAKFKFLNRKMTRLIDMPASYSNEKYTYFANPWGQRFYIVYNTKPGSTLKFKLPIKGSFSSFREVSLSTDIAVFSEVNPNSGDFEKGSRYLTSWNGAVKY